MSTIKDEKVQALESDVFWGEIAPSEHLVQFYEDDDVCLDTLEGFVAGGLRAGESAIVIATPAHLEILAERLAAHGFDLDLARSEGQYIDRDAEAMLKEFMVNGWPDDERFSALVNGIITRARGKNGRKVRAYGEMVALLWANRRHAATVRLEHLWHKQCELNKFSLFCAYPKAGFTRNAAESIREICAAHSKVYPS
jgi:hypothetical protein